jgi:hypothetical protein
LARLSSISVRLVVVPSARAWASSSILRMMPPAANQLRIRGACHD